MTPKRKTAGRKAALTRKRRDAARKAVATRKHRAAGQKAARTRMRRAAARKAASTRAQRKHGALTSQVELATQPLGTVANEPKAESTQPKAIPSDNVKVKRSA